MNHRFLPCALAITFATCAASVGCDREGTRTGTSATMGRDAEPGTTPTTSKVTVNNEQAIQSIADARCDREARCANIGQGKKWAGADACRGDLLVKNREELKASECPGGIVQKELDECLAEIRNENCNNPLDTIGRLAACRSSDLCKATAM